MSSDEFGVARLFAGTTARVPLDLEAEALGSEGATCHVCDAPATFLMEMIDPDSVIGSAIFLCGADRDLVSRNETERIVERLAITYEDSFRTHRRTASLMTSGTGRSVPLSTL